VTEAQAPVPGAGSEHGTDGPSEGRTTRPGAGGAPGAGAAGRRVPSGGSTGRRPGGRPELAHHFHPPDPTDTVDHPVDSRASRPVGPRPPRPWYQQILGQWPLAVTLLGVGVGVLVTATGHWKRGTGLVGLALAMAMVMRLLLPERLVGLLGVRSRAVDVACLAVLAIGISLLVLVVPPLQP
jgi:hypothetical protein